MPTMTVMRGYSGSGKSSTAYLLTNATGAIRVCRDDIRYMLLDSYWTGKREDEDRVTVIEKAAVVAALEAGNDVIIDATHLEPRYPRAWAKLAGQYGYEFVMHDVKLAVEDCIIRDALRDRSVGAGVIKNQAKRHPANDWPAILPYGPTVEPYVAPLTESLHTKNAIMVDIDGTLAHMNGRSPYDYSAVYSDTLDTAVADLMFYYSEQGYYVILCSGRDGSSRSETVRWLHDNNVAYDELYMRNESHLDPDTGGKQPDWVVKLDLFNAHIRNRFDVQFVLDDRDQVVRLWRRLGLKCFQVAEGKF